MGLWNRLLNWGAASGGVAPSPVMAAAGQTFEINDASQLAEALRHGNVSEAGVAVTPDAAMRVAAVFACVRIISGAVANLPLDIKRRKGGGVREDADDHALWKVLRRKPNAWQSASQFRRLLTTHLLLRGNAYAQIVRSMGRVIALNPLHPDRVRPRQNDDLTLTYVYSRKDGRQVELGQEDVLHLVGLSLDGVTGVSVLTYARETIGLSLAQEQHGARTFKNGAKVSGMLSHPSKLGPEGVSTLKQSLDEFRAGGEREGKDLVLEEGMAYTQIAMTAEDAQWIEGRKFSRSDIAMFFGMPPHMIGDTEKSTSWGTGIEQQSIGFVTWTLEDFLTAWEDAINLRAVNDNEPQIYARFNRSALVKGDIKTRWEAHTKALQWGVLSPDEVRALEDQNPRSDGMGGKYYDPPNTAGGKSETSDEPEKAA